MTRRQRLASIDPELIKSAAALNLIRKLQAMPNPTLRRLPEFVGTATGGVIRTRTGVVYR